MRRMIRRIGAGMLSLALAVSLVSVSGKEVKADGTKDYKWVIYTSGHPIETDTFNDNGDLYPRGVVCFNGDTVSVIPGTPNQTIHKHPDQNGIEHYGYDLTTAVAKDFTGTGYFSAKKSTVQYKIKKIKLNGEADGEEEISCDAWTLTATSSKPTLVKFDQSDHKEPAKQSIKCGECGKELYTTNIVIESLRTEALDGYEYPITFDANGGHLPSGYMAPNTRIERTAHNTSFPVPTRLGYTFDGYSFSVNNVMECKYVAGSSACTVTVNTVTPEIWNNAKDAVNGVTATARWTPTNITLSYDMDGGRYLGSKEKYVDTVSLSDSEKAFEVLPEKEGFTFGGWYLGTKKIERLSDIKEADWNIQNSYYLKAKWERAEINTEGGTGTIGDPYIINLSGYGEYTVPCTGTSNKYFQVNYEIEGGVEYGISNGYVYEGSTANSSERLSGVGEFDVTSGSSKKLRTAGTNSSFDLTFSYYPPNNYIDKDSAYDLNGIQDGEFVDIDWRKNRTHEIWFRFSIDEPSTVVFKARRQNDSFRFLREDGESGVLVSAIAEKNFYDASTFMGASADASYEFTTLDENVFIPTNKTRDDYENYELRDEEAKLSFLDEGTYYIVVKDNDQRVDKGFDAITIRPYIPLTGVKLDAGSKYPDPKNLQIDAKDELSFINNIVGLIPENADGHIASVSYDTGFIKRDEKTKGTKLTGFDLTGKAGENEVKLYDERGELVDSYKVNRLSDVSVADVTLSGTSFTYTGKEIEPTVTVTLGGKTLEALTDYRIEYSNNVNEGTAAVKIVGINSYVGEKKLTFTIVKDPSQAVTTDVPVTVTDPPVTEVPKTTIKKGDKITTSKATYKVTNAEKKEVQYFAPADKKVKTVSIPATVKALDGTSFKVTSVKKNALKNNTKLKAIKIGNNVKTIGDYAFYGCKNVTKLTLGKNVETIGCFAFANCIKLSAVTLPKALKTIKKSAFKGCKVLKTITVNSQNVFNIQANAIKNIAKNCTIKVPKNYYAKYKKKFTKACGFKNTMKLKNK